MSRMDGKKTHTHTHPIGDRYWGTRQIPRLSYNSRCLQQNVSTQFPRRIWTCFVLLHRRYFQHAHFIPIIVVVGKRGAYYLVHGDLPRQHSFGTTLIFIGLVPADRLSLVNASVCNSVTQYSGLTRCRMAV